MILIIASCRDKLHYYEFVKPIENILKELKIPYTIKPISKLADSDFHNFEKIIISGTSLKDNFYLEQKDKYSELANSNIPILGICAGMQIIGVSYFIAQDSRNKNKINHILSEGNEIGFYREFFQKEFLSLKGEQEVYHLHNNTLDFSKLPEFEIISKNNNVVQAVKHKTKEVYGVLFHPEVRQKEIIKSFLKIKS